MAHAAAWISGTSSRTLEGPGCDEENVGGVDFPTVENNEMEGGGGGKTVRVLDSSSIDFRIAT